MTPPLREQMFPVRQDGLKLHVCHWGQEGGRLTVILHGFLDQAAAWGEVAGRLNRWVQAPDHRGHGESDHVPAGGFYHFWDYVSDLDAWLASQEQPVDLIGHSMGGSIAVLFAACRPEKVRRLVLVEGLGPADASHKRVQQAQTFLQHRRTPPRHLSMTHLQVATERLKRHTPSIPDVTAAHLARKITHQMPDGEWTWRWDALHRCRNPHAFDATAFRDFLTAVTSPTLVIEGGQSKMKLEDRNTRIKALAPQKIVLLEQAGHQIHHDAPHELSHAIQTFLDQE